MSYYYFILLGISSSSTSRHLKKPFLLCPPNGVESLWNRRGKCHRHLLSGLLALHCLSKMCPGVNCMYVTNNNFSSFLLSPSFCSGAVGYDQRGFVGLDSLSVWTSISHAWGKSPFTCSHCRYYYYSVPIHIDPRCKWMIRALPLASPLIPIHLSIYKMAEIETSTFFSLSRLSMGREKAIVEGVESYRSRPSRPAYAHSIRAFGYISTQTDDTRCVSFFLFICPGRSTATRLPLDAYIMAFCCIVCIPLHPAYNVGQL